MGAVACVVARAALVVSDEEERAGAPAASAGVRA